MVSGSASYRKLPEMLVRLEAGESRITGLDDRQTEETFETEFTARTNRHRGYITIIEGCDKFCAYCVVPYTRGKERSRTSTSVLAEAPQTGRGRVYRDPVAGAERQLLPRSRRQVESFAELLAAVGEVPGIRRVRFTTSHPRDFTPDIVAAIDAVPISLRPRSSPGTERIDTGAGSDAAGVQPWRSTCNGSQWIRSAHRPISITTDMIVGFPGRDRGGFRADAEPACRRRRFRCGLRISSFRRAQHPCRFPSPTASRKRKRAAACKCSWMRQREIQRSQVTPVI